MKPARFLVFPLTISSSLTFLAVFSIWVLKATPPFQRQQTPPLHLPFNQTPLQSSGRFLPVPVVSKTLDPHVYQGDLSAKSINFFPTGGNVDTSASDDASDPSTATTAANEIQIQVGTTSFNGIHRSNTTSTTTASDTKFSALAPNKNIVPRKPGNTSGSPLHPTSALPSQDLRAKLYNNSGHVPDNHEVKLLSGINPMHENSRVSRSSGSELTCDVTNGMWVFDQSYPLYRNTTCPFIDEGFNCETNGRLDRDYMKWRWQPQACNIPRFNASKMLELIRGKRLVFVGDSLNRNQWESMLCLLMGAIKDPKKVYETRGRKITKSKGDYRFKFAEYKCTVEFYATHFLVHESKARIGKKRVQTLRIDTIDKGSSKWRGADILVFNTAHWWSHHKTKAGVNYYQEGDQIHPRLEVSVALRRALATWASWVDKFVNPRKTRVFFRSSAPSHFSGGQWNAGGHCKEASEPTNATFGTSPAINGLVEEVIRRMKTPVTFLNISGLSSYRIDGHPSVFGRPSEKGSFSGIQDCSHWCLPGVPDSWNELLYYHLLFDVTNSHAE
ncbi:protein trichome birefringence-like 6 [Coffea eugenioides]|uniref:protein trichome birefringence-like 6 n=1 Tax=Coffea eugenioides TaxID=49369 RepID=UPI000F6078F5|nr:protein trichome birefringence-like 6 [Coffea eugenioides]